MDIMATSQADFDHPQFFVSQSERLKALLDVVVDESQMATNPDACINYLDITGILNELLDEARRYSVLTHQQLGLRERDVRNLANMIQTVEEVVADGYACTTSSAKAVSRKRARSSASYAEPTGYPKRQKEMVERNDTAEHDHSNMQPSNSCSSIDTADALEPYWWTMPCCD